MIPNRRRFIQSTGGAGLLAAFGGLGALTCPTTALGADRSGYKALVCVLLKGGMDGIDTLLPVDLASFDALADHRQTLFDEYDVGSGTSSRDRENILALNADNAANFGTRRFGLPANMADMAKMFDDGEMAVVGNVGPLIEPTSRGTMDSFTAQIPQRLFSHNDQQAVWMSMGVEGTQSGWGGRFTDAVATSGSTFASISTAGADLFLAGRTTSPFSAPINGTQSLDVLSKRGRLGTSAGADRAREILRDHLAAARANGDNLLIRDVIKASNDAVVNAEDYNTALQGGMMPATTFPGTGLGRQLQTVANAISVRGALGETRQVFYVSIGGFDTHDSQADDLPALQGQINDAFKAFRDSMIELGVWNDVTLFTASDFGRTAIDNGDGTDHGWGSHHFVMGGSVTGKSIYGGVPSFDLGDAQYTASRGRLIPTVATDQYAATLGKWFGLNASELSASLPNLGNFDTRDLGFLA